MVLRTSFSGGSPVLLLKNLQRMAAQAHDMPVPRFSLRLNRPQNRKVSLRRQPLAKPQSGNPELRP
jgi:hypothetical protein